MPKSSWLNRHRNLRPLASHRWQHSHCRQPLHEIVFDDACSCCVLAIAGLGGWLALRRLVLPCTHRLYQNWYRRYSITSSVSDHCTRIHLGFVPQHPLADALTITLQERPRVSECDRTTRRRQSSGTMCVGRLFGTTLALKLSSHSTSELQTNRPPNHYSSGQLTPISSTPAAANIWYRSETLSRVPRCSQNRKMSRCLARKPRRRSRCLLDFGVCGSTTIYRQDQQRRPCRTPILCSCVPVAHTRTLTDGPVALRPSWISHKKPAVLLSCQTATSAFPLTSVAMLFAPARRVIAGKMIQTT